MSRSEDDVMYEALVFVPIGCARGRGRPRRHYYDTIKMHLQDRGIAIHSKTQTLFWEQVAELADNKQEWQSVVKRRH